MNIGGGVNDIETWWSKANRWVLNSVQMSHEMYYHSTGNHEILINRPRIGQTKLTDRFICWPMKNFLDMPGPRNPLDCSPCTTTACTRYKNYTPFDSPIRRYDVTRRRNTNRVKVTNESRTSLNLAKIYEFIYNSVDITGICLFQYPQVVKLCRNIVINYGVIIISIQRIGKKKPIKNERNRYAVIVWLIKIN